MTDMREKIAAIIVADVDWHTDNAALWDGVRAADNILKALPDCVAQQARIDTLERALAFISCEDNAEGKLARAALKGPQRCAECVCKNGGDECNWIVQKV